MKSDIYKLIGTWSLLILWVSCTNPTHLSVFAIFIVFTLIYMATYMTCKVLCLLFVASSKVDTKKAKNIATVVATLSVVTVALQSIGQLSAKDLVVASAVITLGYFYLRRTQAKR